MVAAQQREEAKKPENWGIGRAVRRQGDVKIVSDAKGKPKGAKRLDVFARFHARGAMSEAAYSAARRLDADLTERRGEGNRGQSEKVDGAGSRDLVSQRMLDAGRRVDLAIGMIGRRDGAILVELMAPRKVFARVVVEPGTAAGEPERRTETERWRLVIATMSGETHINAQGAVLRSACENLALAYREIDRRPQRAA